MNLTSNFYVMSPFPINDAAFVSSNVAEADYGAWSNATSYALGDRVIVVDTDVHNIYESLQAANVNHDPTLDPQRDATNPPTWWVLVSTTNRWKMWDNSNSSQTENADTIEVELTISSRPNAVFFGNTDAQTIQVIMEDALANEVFNETYQMYENTGTPSYYSWFLAQLQRKTDLLVQGLPPLAGGTITAILDKTGSVAKCGTMLVGFAEAVGWTELGSSIGIQDFSVKRQNEFGDFEVLERAFNRVGEFNIFTSNSNVDRLQGKLARLRATPVLYVGSTRYAATYIYGFYRDYNIVIQYPNHSLLNIQIDGLT